MTAEEKEEKRKLKKRLKVQQKIKKLETRIRHAISRKDPVVEEKTRQELNALLKSNSGDNGIAVEVEDHSSSGDVGSNSDENRKIDDNNVCGGDVPSICNVASSIVAKNIIIDMSNKLHQSFEVEKTMKMDTNADHDAITKQNNNNTDCSKEHQTKCAVKLLKNMTKGTVDQSMFENKAALIGYTRQKFFERAMLLYSSMERLQQPIPVTVQKMGQSDVDVNSYNCEIDINAKQMEIKERMWHKMQSGHIHKACSIGCGPGNDALGLLTFFHTMRDQNDGKMTTQSICLEPSRPKQNIALDEIILADWTIQQWDSAVLKPLSHVLKESKLAPRSDIMKPYFCDVTKALSDQENKGIRGAMHACDIYLVSYLLSETNGKWESFFGGLIDLAKSESLFYFAEPTPWQLHRLIELFSTRLDFLWLDSSMYQPSMQSLDGRLGPGILAAIKR